MKKLLVVAALGMFTLGFSQNYQNGYNDYNDYQGSISSINWGQVASYLGLNNNQVNQLTVLNNRYPDQNAWNRAYSKQPNRWYTDRYSAMEKIMTPEQYKRFYAKYYQGQNPKIKFDNEYKKHHSKPQKNHDKYQMKHDERFNDRDHHDDHHR